MNSLPFAFRWIAASDCLLEIDLEDNLIGDVAAAELIEGLLERSEGLCLQYSQAWGQSAPNFMER